MTDQQSGFRAGYIAVIGEPNVGKSTLINTLVGQKVTIVTNKPQTTRHRILAIASRPGCQAVFLDTPGMLRAKYRLHDAMMSAARSAIGEADLLLLMLDATSPESAENIAFEAMHATGKPAFLVVNKVDLVRKESLLPLIAGWSERYPFAEVFPISALHSIGTDDLMSAIAGRLPEHPPFYPPDIVSEQPERFFVAELVREKIFETFREEIPYSTTVDILEFTEREGQKDLIRAEIYVERESQRRILIGRKGTALKDIGMKSRAAIEQFLQRPVYLELFVKVREKWREDEGWLRRLGYHE